jgi:hypothetical protein
MQGESIGIPFPYRGILPELSVRGFASLRCELGPDLDRSRNHSASVIHKPGLCLSHAGMPVTSYAADTTLIILELTATR